MTTVLTTYPAGWGASSVAAVCGDSASYRLGSCGLRWSYGLAVAATADCFLLGLLALSLAAKQRLALGEAEAGFLISNMEHAAPDTKGQVVLAQERCAAYSNSIQLTIICVDIQARAGGLQRVSLHSEQFSAVIITILGCG